MQVKIFESDNISTGLRMVKEELGPDALILSTKTIRSGKLGILGKSHFEITAAIDTSWPHKGGTKLADTLKTKVQETQSERDILLAPLPDDHRPKTDITYNSALQFNRPQEPTTTTPIREVASRPESKKDTQLQDEVNELKGMIKNLGQEMLRINSPHTAVSIKNSHEVKNSQSAPIASLQQRLRDYGISNTTAETITGFAKESLTLDEISDPFKQQQFTHDIICDLLQVNPNVFQEEKRQHRIALVGPTGVGKTTTLAKIAAQYLSHNSPKIGFITIDTYRIAAVEQLKVYGDIMNIPVEVVITPEQLEHALLKLRDKDLILIDTAGRSPQDSHCLDELKSFLRPDLEIDTHLVLSATTRESELFDAIQRFSVLGIDHSIITKIDECTSLGLLLDIQIREKIPYSYVTNGQRVPEDIIEANKNSLAQLIMTPGKGLPNE